MKPEQKGRLLIMVICFFVRSYTVCLRINISCICISLSRSYYSNELQDWLHQNASVVKVYASYNNTPNTFDYPAQYTDVIGVGSNPEIAYKNVDINMFILIEILW